MNCWVTGCGGAHDVTMHPEHNCPIPADRPTEWQCKCGKQWRATTHGYRLEAP